MSQTQLFTMGFLGIGSDKNGIPQLGSAMDCHQKILHKRSIHSSLGKIRPHMLQQVLSHGCLSDSDIFHREAHIGVSEGIKAMDLFPQQSLGFQSNRKQDDSQSVLLDTQIEISEAATTNSSSAQLTIFYGGALKVYNNVSSSKAEAIMMFAAANGDALPSTTASNITNCLRKSVSNSEESTEGGKQSHAVETSNANLPIIKKLSLQRFLEKRKDRISKLIPYVTSSKGERTLVNL